MREIDRFQVAFVHRGLTKYRLPLYRILHKRNIINFRVFCERFDLSPEKVGFSQPNSNDIDGLPIKRISVSDWKVKFQIRFKIALPTIKILKEIIYYKPDLIIFESLSNVGSVLFFTPYILIKKIPFIWWGLGKIPERKKSIRSIIGDFIQRWYVKRAKAVFSYSTFGKNFFISLGATPNKIYVLYNTIDEVNVLQQIEKCKPLVPKIKKTLDIKNQPVAIFSGTINPGKKLELLIKAFIHVKNALNDKDPRLIVIGDGVNLEKCKQLSERLGLGDSIHFVGRQETHASIYFLFGNVAVMPGLGGLGINHAFIHKLPMICGYADGCEMDLVKNGDTGFLITDISEETISKKLIELLNNNKLAKELGRNAFELITKRITMSNMASKIENAIKLEMNKI